jgi:hypothetical protein
MAGYLELQGIDPPEPWGQPQGIVGVVGGSRRTAALSSAEHLQPQLQILDKARQGETALSGKSFCDLSEVPLT